MNIIRIHRLYIVHMDESQHRHAEFRHQAPYVITDEPSAGDRIAFVLNTCMLQTVEHGRVVEGQASVDLYSEMGGPDPTRIVRLKSRPGRYASISEDIESASGEPALVPLWLERLNGADWQYAPIDIEAVEASRKQLFNRLKARFDPNEDEWVMASIEESHIA